MDLELQLSLYSQQQLLVNPRRIRLLEQIQNHGSISQGAKAAGISYKSAWDAIKAMNDLFEQPVITSEAGGKGGGGAQLTPYGTRLIKVYGLLNQIERMAVDALQDEHTSLDSLLSVVARFSLQTSARNQLFSHVTQLKPVDLSHTVELQLKDGSRLYADITERSCARLNLAVNKEVLALIKAPWVTLSAPSDSPPPGKNQLLGAISEIVLGDELDEYLVQLDLGETLCALLTKEQSQQRTFAIGDRVQANFAPSHVILATLE